MDLTANPYLLLAGLLAAGARMPEPVDVDPAALPPEKATLGGARLLGWDDQIGSIEPGKQADLAV